MNRYFWLLALLAVLPGVSGSGLLYAANGNKAVATAKAGAANPGDYIGSDIMRRPAMPTR